MKKLFILPFILLSLLACNENVDFENPAETTSYAFVDSFYVPFETALTYAEQMLNKENGSTRTSTKRKVAEHYEYITNNATRSTGENIDVRFHVINFENNQGFALVSADSRTTPVYAYSSTGNLNIDESIENSGFGDFMDAATEHYAMEIDFTGDLLPITPTPINPIVNLPLEYIDGIWCHMAVEEVNKTNANGILVKAEWHQKWPYNYYCGENTNATKASGYRNAAGCGPLAAAMIMSYYSYPASFGGYTLEWNKINSSIKFNESYPQISENAKAAARLINLVGISADADYGLTTGIYMSGITAVFNDFGYNFNGPSAYSSAAVINSLDSSCPILIAAQNVNLDGHMWIIDGYNITNEIKTYYYQTPPYDLYRRTTNIKNEYLHCNWGWGYDKNNSSCWCLNVFNSPNGQFNTNKQIFYNIQPNN